MRCGAEDTSCPAHPGGGRPAGPVGGQQPVALQPGEDPGHPARLDARRRRVARQRGGDEASPQPAVRVLEAHAPAAGRRGVDALPGARGRDGAGAAAGPPRRADGRAQLHRRLVEDGGPPRAQQLGGAGGQLARAALSRLSPGRPITRRTLVSIAARGVPREGGHGGGGVRAHAGQLLEVGGPAPLLEATEVEGAAGAGMVKVVLTGKGDLRRVAIDPSLMAADEREVLEDLLVAAHADAKQKVEAVMAEEMQKATGGLNLPGRPAGRLQAAVLTQASRRARPMAEAADPIEHLIGLLSRLPGLGRRSARRAVLRC